MALPRPTATYARVFAAEDADYYLRHRLPFIADGGRLAGQCEITDDYPDGHVYTVRSGRTVIASGPCYLPDPLTLHALPNPVVARVLRHRRIVRKALDL
jgi:hypothetical protein